MADASICHQLIIDVSGLDKRMQSPMSRLTIRLAQGNSGF
jgi:hypothetical protein